MASSHRFHLGRHCVTTCTIRNRLDVLQLPLPISQRFSCYQYSHLHSNGSPTTIPPSMYLKGSWPRIRRALRQLCSNDRRKCCCIRHMLIVVPHPVRHKQPAGQCLFANPRRGAGDLFSSSVLCYVSNELFHPGFVGCRTPSHHLSCFRGQSLDKRYGYTPCHPWFPHHASSVGPTHPRHPTTSETSKRSSCPQRCRTLRTRRLSPVR